jgi:hypothetical protein
LKAFSETCNIGTEQLLLNCVAARANGQRGPAHSGAEVLPESGTRGVFLLPSSAPRDSRPRLVSAVPNRVRCKRKQKRGGPESHRTTWTACGAAYLPGVSESSRVRYEETSRRTHWRGGIPGRCHAEILRNGSLSNDERSPHARTVTCTVRIQTLRYSRDATNCSILYSTHRYDLTTSKQTNKQTNKRLCRRMENLRFT